MNNATSQQFNEVVADYNTYNTYNTPTKSVEMTQERGKKTLLNRLKTAAELQKRSFRLFNGRCQGY